MAKIVALLALTICFASCLLSIVDARDIPSFSDRWTELEEGKPLGPEKTLKLMRELQEYYKTHQEKDVASKRDQLERLLWLRERNEDKCTEKSWEKYLKLLIKYHSKTVNIVPYLVHEKDELAKYCVGRGEENLYTTNVSAWIDLYNQLYDMDGPPIGNEQTLEVLKKIRNLLRDLNDKSSVKKLATIDKLIDISKIKSDSKCSWSSWNIFDELYAEHEDKGVNLPPYITYWKEKQRDMCKRSGFSEADLIKLSDPNDLYTKIFGPQSVSLENEKTLELLKHLSALYKNSPPKTQPHRERYVQELIDLSDFTKQTCTRESWNQFLSLLERYEESKMNIYPYLMNSKKEIGRFCRGKTNNTFLLFDSDPFDYREIHDRVLNPGASELDPRKTMDLLKKLYDSYENRTDEGSLDRRERVERFLNLTRFSSSKCSKEGMASLYELYNLHQFDGKNIRYYLNHCRLELEKYCATRGNSYKVDYGRWFDAEEELYDSRSGVKPIGNERTLELIRYLTEQYLTHGKDLGSMGAVWKLERLGDLLEMSKPSKEKCNDTAAAKVRALLNFYEGTVNVLPYLEYWRNEQSKLCKA